VHGESPAAQIASRSFDICEIRGARCTGPSPSACPAPSRIGGLLLADGLNLIFAANGFVFLLEAVNATGGIDQLLLTGEEWVAAGADFHADVAFVRGTRLEVVAAGADDADFVVSGVNSSLHDITGGSFRNFSITKRRTPREPSTGGVSL
jgi:hypothetical protein